MAIPKSEIQHCPSELTITDFDDISRCATEAIWSDPRTSRCKNFTPRKNINIFFEDRKPTLN